jgi:hypothetical protein
MISERDEPSPSAAVSERESSATETSRSQAFSASTAAPSLHSTDDVAASVLGEWAASRPVEDGPEQDAAEPTEPAEQLEAAESQDDSAPDTEYIPPSSSGSGGGCRRRQKGLTPEQVAKLAAGMKKAVVKVNIFAAELCVGFLGRDPCPLDDDEVELLSVGWEMMLEEWFGKNRPEPWMIIVAGNVAVLLAMYVRGTDKAEKPTPFKLV